MINYKNLNNKGMTLIELLVCFVIVSAIIVSMFNVIMSYKTEEQTESIRSDIIAYKNSITKMIQRDIIQYELKEVDLQIANNSDRTTTYRFTLHFNKPIIQTQVDDPKKNLEILISENDKTEAGYIIYDEKNTKEQLQPSKYTLSNISPSGNNQALRFTSVNSSIFLNGATTGSTQGAAAFNLDIGITHSELGGDYHINIVAPLNYTYTK